MTTDNQKRLEKILRCLPLAVDEAALDDIKWIGAELKAAWVKLDEQQGEIGRLKSTLQKTLDAESLSRDVQAKKIVGKPNAYVGLLEMESQLTEAREIEDWAHSALDATGIPRHDDHDKPLQLHGRISRLHTKIGEVESQLTSAKAEIEQLQRKNELLIQTIEAQRAKVEKLRGACQQVLR